MKHRPPRRIQYRQALQRLQQRAEAMTRGDFSELGQPINGEHLLENVRRAVDVLGEHVQQGHQTMHSFVAALTNAQEAERGRLARDLHDDTVQRLVVLTQHVDRSLRLLERDPAQATDQLRTIRSDIVSLVQSLRTIIADLRPPALEELGLRPALEVLTRPNDAQSPSVTLQEIGRPRRLSEQSELVVFRVVQESWSNIRRHAAASHVAITLHYTPEALHVEITDDGRGFQPHASDTRHFGLLGMQERAALIGGTIVITSQPNQGTRVQLTVPYPGVANRDLVCDMQVSAADLGTVYNDEVYRFCSAACRELFLASPERYVARLNA